MSSLTLSMIVYIKSAMEFGGRYVAFNKVRRFEETDRRFTLLDTFEHG